MKRLFILFLLLLFLIPAKAQFLRTGSLYTNNIVPPVGYETEYDDLLDYWENDPNDTIKTYQNALVKSLDSLEISVGGSAWDNMVGLYVFADTIEANCLTNWVNPGTYDATIVNDGAGALTWTKREGYEGDGVSDYISLNYNPTSTGDTTNFGNNHATLAVYQRVQAFSGGYDIGYVDCYIYAGTIVYIRTRINTGTTLQLNLYNATVAAGFLMSTRRADNDIEVYRDGVGMISGTTASTGVVNGTFRMLANTTPTYSTHQVSIAVIMDAVSDTDASNIYTIFQRYMTRLGTQVHVEWNP